MLKKFLADVNIYESMNLGLYGLDYIIDWWINL